MIFLVDDDEKKKRRRRKRRREQADDDETTVDVWVKIALCEYERTHCSSNYKCLKEKKSCMHIYLYTFVVSIFFFFLPSFFCSLTYPLFFLYTEKKICSNIYSRVILNNTITSIVTLFFFIKIVNNFYIQFMLLSIFFYISLHV